MYKLWVVGIGPGHENYILPIAKIKVKEAEVIYGSQRHLKAFETSGEKKVFTMPLSENLQKIKVDLKTQQVAVLVSGDTGFYSMLNMIKKYFDTNEIETFPGISSLSYMFSKLNITYENALLTSVHGRELSEELMEGYKTFGFLTDKKHNSKWLQDKFKDKTGKIHMGYDLSYETEEILSYDLKDEWHEHERTLCVVVIDLE